MENHHPVRLGGDVFIDSVDDCLRFAAEGVEVFGEDVFVQGCFTAVVELLLSATWISIIPQRTYEECFGRHDVDLVLGSVS